MGGCEPSAWARVSPEASFRALSPGNRQVLVTQWTGGELPRAVSHEVTRPTIPLMAPDLAGSVSECQSLLSEQQDIRHSLQMPAGEHTLLVPSLLLLVTAQPPPASHSLPQARPARAA